MHRKTIHQQKIGRYKADFVLPELKVILEVDGSIYHRDSSKEGERDTYICLCMGAEWTVVRVKDYMINKDITKLMTGIDESVKYQRRLK